MSMILSHRTAQLYHRLRGHDRPRASLPAGSSELKNDPVDTSLAQPARRLLMALGAEPDDVARLDVLVRRDCDRRTARGVVAHAWRFPLPERSLIKIGHGIYVTDVLLTAQQLARQMGEVELVEYLLELCGEYALPPDGGNYRSCPHLVAPGEIKGWTDRVRGQHGANKLRRALSWVRPGARSPMETAFFMMLLMPRRLGGLGISELELAHRIDVTGEACGLTRRKHFECDAYAPSSRTDFEYNGIIHETEEQLAIDVERANALEAMGYNVMTITRHAFFDPEAFRRLMLAIERKAGRRADRVPEGFAERQEGLRRFVLRRHIE